MKRQILYFHRMRPSEKRAHAVQIVRTVTAIARLGAPVRLYLRKDNRGTPPGAPLSEALGIPGVRIVTIRWRRGARWPLVRRLAAWRARSLRSPLPVVYLREVDLYAVVLAETARCFGLPVIYEAHNVKCLVMEESRGSAEARMWEEMERLIYRNASGVIFTAPLIEGFARERFQFEAPVLVAPNAAPNEPVPRSAAGADPGRDIEILYAGQLYRWKGFDLLLEAIALLPDRTLTVVGGGAEGSEDLSRAREQAGRLGVAGRVRFLGQVSPREALLMMARARAGVIPLPAEGSVEARYFTAPLKLFEFWAAGLPFVATDLPSMRALVADGETGLLVPADPQSIAAGLARLLDDRQLAGRLSEAGRRKAGEHTWEQRARRILSFLDEALG